MEILIKPIVTEKMTGLGDKFNRYGFFVARKANKLQIRKAIEELYGVKVEEVNTLIVGGKRKSRYSKSGVQKGRQSTIKKAIITLAEGDSIDFYSNI